MIFKWISRLNRSIIFDPARWPHREAISRGAALAVVGVLLVMRLYHFERFPQFFEDTRRFYSRFETVSGTPLYSDAQIWMLWGIKLVVWMIETAIYWGYIAAYAGRAAAAGIAKGFMQVAFPFLVAGLPVLMSFMPYSLPRWLPCSSGRHLSFYLVIMGLIVVGGLVNLVGLLTMRRAFTIMSEARILVTRGIFRYVRHPLYSGHLIMFFGSMLLRLHAVTVVLYLLFLAGQVVRARIEERKLSAVFDGYAQYQRQTGMFWPRRPGVEPNKDGRLADNS